MCIFAGMQMAVVPVIDFAYRINTPILTNRIGQIRKRHIFFTNL